MSNSAKPCEQSPTSTTLGDSHSSSTEAAGQAPHRPSRASREIAGLTGDYSLTRSESSTSAPDADGNFFSVALDDFSIHGLVGEGEFGKVMMATKKDTGQLYAMKVLRKEHLLLRGKTSVAQAITEKQVLQEMSARPHPFIVSLCYAFQDLEHLFLVMDFVGGGDLFTLLEQKQRFPEAWVEVYAGEMVLALEHVHAANVIFRDLKPENVMVAMDGHLKLTDFGMSKRLGVGGERTGTICGTPEYLAPEVLQGMPYDGAVDWWTVGCLTYEMLTGQSPFKSGDMARMVQQIVRGDLDLPTWLSEAARSLIGGLLERKPAQRLGSRPPPTPPLPLAELGSEADAIKAHAFFEKMDWRALYEKKVEPPCKPSALRNPNMGGAGSSRPDSAASGETAAAAVETLQREFVSWSSSASMAAARSAATPSPTATTAPNTPLINDRLGALRQVPTPGSGSPPTPGPTSASVTSSPWSQSPVQSTRSLSLELTGDGHLWSISPSLAKLLGYLRNQASLLIGTSLLAPETTIVCAADLPRFRELFFAQKERLFALHEAGGGADDGDSKEEAEGERRSNGAADDGDGDGGGDDHSELLAPWRQAGAWSRMSRAGWASGGTTTSVAKSGRRRPRFSSAKNLSPTLARPRAGSSPKGAAAAAGAASVGSSSFDSKEDPEEGGGGVARRVSTEVKPWRPHAAPDLTEAAKVRLQGLNGRQLVFSCVFDLVLPEASLGKKAEPHIAITATDITGAEANKDLVRRRYEWSYNAKRPDDDLRTLFSDKVSFNAAGTRAPLSAQSLTFNGTFSASGLETYLDRRRLFVRAFPDIHFEILEQSNKGDGQVFTSWQWTGTHLGQYHYRTYDGEFRDIPPTGRRVHLTGLAVDVCKNGRIVDHSAYYDEAALRFQITDRKGGAAKDRLGRLSPGVQPEVQLLLHTERGVEGTTFVAALTRVAPVGTPRPDKRELDAQVEMRSFYCNKFMRGLAGFGGDGFCLCEENKVGDGAALNVLLCSSAFLLALGLSPDAALKADLLALLDALEPAGPQTAVSLAPAVVAAAAADRAATATLGFAAAAEKIAAAAAAAANPATAARGAVRRAFEAAIRTEQPLQHAFGARRADGEHVALLLSAAPERYQGKVYWGVMLLDLFWDVSQPPPPPPPPPAPSAADKRAGRPQRSADRNNLGNLFWHQLPRSWTWFNAKLLVSVLEQLLHQMVIGFTLVDISAEDQPMVWLSRNFERITGFTRSECIGRNCRFLQSDQTDPVAVSAIRRGVGDGKHVRVHVWNDGREFGFWQLLSLHPAFDQDGDLRYYLGVQVPLSRPQLNQITQLQAWGTQLAEKVAEPSAPLMSGILRWRNEFEAKHDREVNERDLRAAFEAAMSAVHDPVWQTPTPHDSFRRTNSRTPTS